MSGHLLLSDEPAKGDLNKDLITMKRSTAALVAMTLLATGALASMSAQRVFVSPSSAVDFSAAPLGTMGTTFSLAAPAFQFRTTPAQRSGVIAYVNNRKKSVSSKRMSGIRGEQTVVLTRDREHLGKTGDVVSVKNGYARNYLLPYKWAKPFTKELELEMRKKKAIQDAKREEEKADFIAIKGALEAIGKFVITKKVGEAEGDEKKIFGSVTQADVAASMRLQTGMDVDKKAIDMPEIKTTGTYDATVKLHPEVVGKFKIVVSAD